MSDRAEVLWLEACARDVPAHDSWLGPQERAALAELSVPKRRSDWRLGRWVAKRAVAARLGTDAAVRVEIRAAPDGVPEAYCDGVRLALSLSLSHSAGRACCGVAGAGVRLGCDVEHVEPRPASFVADFFTTEEARAISEAVPARRDLAATLVWSAKESALKAVREGLRLDTRDVPVAVGTVDWDAPAGSWHPLEVARFRGWWRHDGALVHTVVAEPAPAQPLMAP